MRQFLYFFVGVGFCDANTTQLKNETLSWPETVAGETASIVCPSASSNATRLCGSDRVWQEPNVTLCELAANIISQALTQPVSPLHLLESYSLNYDYFHNGFCIMELY